MLSLDGLRSALSATPPTTLPVPPAPGDRAAVAAIFAGPSDALSLCLIQRAQRQGDRWSGQMALPGGRTDASDASAQHTATRETHEEVGLVLAHEHLLGRLSDLQLRRHGSPTDGVLTPFVFYVGTGRPRLTGNDEVAAIYWAELRALWSADNHTTFQYESADLRREFPAIQVADQVVWGLTYRVLTMLGETCALPSLPQWS